MIQSTTIRLPISVAFTHLFSFDKYVGIFQPLHEPCFSMNRLTGVAFSFLAGRLSI